jgi:hypothetical protein
MREKILEIVRKLEFNMITENEAENLLLELFGVGGFNGYCNNEILEGKRCKDMCDKSQCGY